MKQLGDITKIDGADIEPVDIITAGSPCQNLSIAGNRKGLAGDQSSLFMEAMRIVNEMREATDGKYPRFFVWENVPGAFTSNKGMDFKSVLEEIGATEVPMPDRWAYAGLVQCDRCEIAWRVLDAQFWGVPQRRKRIFLVADFAADHRCAGEILFKCEGVQGNPASGEGARQGAASGIEGCAGTSDGDGSLTPFMHQGSRVQSEDGTSAALNANGAGGTKNEPVLQLYDAQRHDEFHERDVAHTLDTGCGSKHYENIVRHKPVVLKIRQPKKKGGGSGAMWKEDQAYTLIAHQEMTTFERGFND